MEINIITPVTRVGNLPTVYQSLKNQPIKIIWWIVLDPKVHQYLNLVESSFLSSDELNIKVVTSNCENNLGGYSHRNLVMDLLSPEDWVLCIDDDTILHENLMTYINDFDIMSRYSGIIFAQVVKSGAIRLDVREDKIVPCHVDMGSILFKMDIVGSMRFLEGHYTSDGYFIRDLYEQNKEKFTLRNIPLSYYNYIDMNNELEPCPVSCLQNKKELIEILDLYGCLNPKKAMEIGSFFGGTLYYWLKRAPELQKMISIDYPIPSSDGRYMQMLESKIKWFEWLKMSQANFLYFPSDSTNAETIKSVSEVIPDRDLDFLFIDGGHHYQIVKSDYENYAPFVKKGGIVAFHDIYSIGDVTQFWNEIKIGKKSLEIHDVENNGDGIGVLFM